MAGTNAWSSDMSLPEPALIVLPLLCLVIGAVFTGREIFLVRRDARVDGQVRERVCRRCRYCALGYARLSEEKIRCEGDSLVEVRTFVCANCGLPQWTIQRTPLAEWVG